MKQISLGKVAIATATFACTALLSVSWSEQRGVSLGVESAQARIGRPLTPFSVAGVARRQYRQAAYGYRHGARLGGAGGGGGGGPPLRARPQPPHLGVTTAAATLAATTPPAITALIVTAATLMVI